MRDKAKEISRGAGDKKENKWKTDHTKVQSNHKTVCKKRIEKSKEGNYLKRILPPPFKSSRNKTINV